MLVQHFTEDEAQAIIVYCKENDIKCKVKHLNKPLKGEDVNVSIWAYIDWRDSETYGKYHAFADLVRLKKARHK
jgi:hypothetical protein